METEQREFEMSQEEKDQLIGRYAHHWCDFLYKLMDEITHTDLNAFLKHHGFKLLNPNAKPEPDNSQHWVYAMQDDFINPSTKKSVNMTISFFGAMHVRANTQNLLEAIVRLARGSGSTPQEVSRQIIEFKRKEGDYAKDAFETPDRITTQPPAKNDPLAGVKRGK